MRQPRRAEAGPRSAPGRPAPLIVRLGVAGLTLAVRSRRPSASLRLAPAFRPFARRRGADILLDLVETPIPAPRAQDLLFDSGGVWRVYRYRHGLLYLFRTAALEPPLYKAVAIDGALSRGRLHFHARAGGPPNPLDFPLDELLFQHRLAREGGMEVHSCGIVLGGRAVLFCGQSGAGKSTTARLWRRHRRHVALLSDDRVALRSGPRGFRAYGTPWHGDGGFAAPLAAPLGALFFLRHARSTRVRRLGPAETAARLFARSFPPPWDRRAIARVLKACGGAALEVPGYELAFCPDASAVEAVLDCVPVRR